MNWSRLFKIHHSVLEKRDYSKCHVRLNVPKAVCRCGNQTELANGKQSILPCVVNLACNVDGGRSALSLLNISYITLGFILTSSLLSFLMLFIVFPSICFSLRPFLCYSLFYHIFFSVYPYVILPFCHIISSLYLSAVILCFPFYLLLFPFVLMLFDFPSIISFLSFLTLCFVLPSIFFRCFLMLFLFTFYHILFIFSYVFFVLSTISIFSYAVLGFSSLSFSTLFFVLCFFLIVWYAILFYPIYLFHLSFFFLLLSPSLSVF